MTKQPAMNKKTNRFWKMLRPVRHFLSGILTLSLLILVIGIISSRSIEVNIYNVEAPLSSPLRIVQITDLHNREFGSGNKKLIEKIKGIEPDLILITGDMINSDDENLSVITDLIGRLCDIAPVYYGYGNHESSWEKHFQKDLYFPLTEAGATVLNSTYTDIKFNNETIRIGGVMNYYRRWGMMAKDKETLQTQETFANLFEDTDHYKILLNHIPTTFSDWGGIDDYPVDLVFTGHYHGGMVRIPFLDQGVFAPYMGFFPPHTKGMLQGTQGICIQSAGLGSEHMIPRIYNPPEIVVVNLQVSQ